MSETDNLTDQDAIHKIRSLVNDASTCMFATQLGQVPFHVCPMQAQQTDRDGRIWFFSAADSAHNQHIVTDPRVNLIFSNPSAFEFLTLYGKATITRDPKKVDELWNQLVSNWFPGGKEDPNLSLICVEPENAHYWDTKHNKFLTMAKLIGAAVSGNEPTVGVEGDLKV